MKHPNRIASGNPWKDPENPANYQCELLIANSARSCGDVPLKLKSGSQKPAILTAVTWHQRSAAIALDKFFYLPEIAYIRSESRHVSLPVPLHFRPTSGFGESNQWETESIPMQRRRRECGDRGSTAATATPTTLPTPPGVGAVANPRLLFSFSICAAVEMGSLSGILRDAGFSWDSFRILGNLDGVLPFHRDRR